MEYIKMLKREIGVVVWQAEIKKISVETEI